MITGQTLVTLTITLLMAAVAAVEIRKLRIAAWAYLIQSLILCLILVVYAWLSTNASLYLWAATCLVSKGIVIPWLLLRYIRRVPQIEYRPMLGFALSVILLLVMMVALYRLFYGAIFLLAPVPHIAEVQVRSLMAGACVVFCLGLWTLLSRRDVIKTVIGLGMMENAVHLLLLALAPQLKETTMIGILTNVVAAVFILLYLSADIYRLFGSTDTARLSELKR
ncbi:MAG TPA: NADH-quinone oxidoreductase subunit K [bacterium]|nr:NADH-quinone oxidoreductase subunit K [bacterium]HPR88135.1 NADH-quinone oxidoreductase subunit K [bacterium]